MALSDSQISMRSLCFSVVYTYRLHVCNMFEKMPSIASMGLVKGLFNELLLLHCFHIILFLLRYHYILGSGLGSRPKKVAKIPGMLA